MEFTETIQKPNSIMGLKTGNGGFPKELKEIFIPFLTKIEQIIFDIDTCIISHTSSGKSADIAAMELIRLTLKENPQLKISFCTNESTGYVRCLAQCLDAFYKLEPWYQEAFFQKTGIKLEGPPSIIENGSIIYDIRANKIYPMPTITEEQIRCLSEVRFNIIPGLSRKMGFIPDVSIKHFCISLCPGCRQTVEELCNILTEELSSCKKMLGIECSSGLVHIIPKGISKAKSIKYIMEKMEINPDVILGAGNCTDDARWLQQVGSAAICNNGIIPLLKIHNLRYVSPFVEAIGALDIVEKVVENNKNFKFCRRHVS